VTDVRLDGWTDAPVVGVVVPDEGAPGWADAAFWSALLQAWGVPSSATNGREPVARPWTTLVVPSALDRETAERVAALDGVSVVLAGPSGPGGEILGGRIGVVRFDASADALDAATTEETVDAAERAFLAAAGGGAISLWRWPDGKDFGLVVDGDVDHPTGIDPQCARYVAPAIGTARRAGYGAYGIFAAAANVDAEAASFPPGAEYYNHSYTHPYSHWNARTWEDLDTSEMREELMRSNETFRRRLGTDDHRMFRLPHFQLEACDRTYDVLEELGYLADSSIGGNVSVTGGLPFHPARAAWSSRRQDAAYARTHPDPARRRPFLQLPISTDPTAPGFPHGCCSYNTLGEGVRSRTADPTAYEEVLDAVVEREAARHGLAHLFIDPPDAGYGRLEGDRPDYASAIERWLARSAARDDVSILSASALARWWLDREAAIARLTARRDGDGLILTVPDPPAGASLAVRLPGDDPVWHRIPIPQETR
jgi:peptidoglycan/xylan/chitin deacetylase (PgdA/CDA1 family)